MLLRSPVTTPQRRRGCSSPVRRAGAVPLPLTKTWEVHHPKGVVGVISPWNYPLTLGISDALPAPGRR